MPPDLGKKESSGINNYLILKAMHKRRSPFIE
jgi:hypothetical protein